MCVSQIGVSLRSGFFIEAIYASINGAGYVAA